MTCQFSVGASLGAYLKLVFEHTLDYQGSDLGRDVSQMLSLR